MKKVIMIALGMCLVAGMTSLSRGADEPAPKKDREARHAELLKKYDKNGDGKLDESERAAMREDLRKKRQEHKDAPAPKPEQTK